MDKSIFDIALDDLKETFTQLGAVDGRELGPLLPTSIKVRQADGSLKETPALLAVTSTDQKRKARLRARELMARFKLATEVDGEDKAFFSECENLEILAFALRDPKSHAQMYKDGEDLIRSFKVEALEPVLSELSRWCDMNSPRYGQLSSEQLWDLIRRVAEGGNPLPLASIGGVEQAGCIVLMAREALHSPNAPWFTPPPSTTP